MKTTILVSTLFVGLAVAGTSVSANTITIDAIDVTELSSSAPEQAEAFSLLHTVKGKKGGGRRGHNRGSRGDNLASDGNIGNGTLRARIQHEQQQWAERNARLGHAAPGHAAPAPGYVAPRNQNNSYGPFGFLGRIFGH